MTSPFHELALPQQVLIARRGTSYFAQRLAELTDTQLGEPSLLPGWTRKHLLAHVSYNAVALCRLLDWAATGVETPMYESPEQRGAEITEGATLTPSALRNLFDHTVARLDEKWRNLPDPSWKSEVRTAQGRIVHASETVWMRTREVWIHAVDLHNGGRFSDLPVAVLESLLNDIVSLWRTRRTGAGLELATGDIRVIVDSNDPIVTHVKGELPAVVRWAAGRGSIGVSTDAEPPPWL